MIEITLAGSAAGLPALRKFPRSKRYSVFPDAIALAILTGVAFHNSLSDASLMSLMRAFIQAIIVGSLAASWFPLIITITFALGSLPQSVTEDGELLLVLWLALMPFLIAMAIVDPAMIVIGLPVTWFLRLRSSESQTTYVVIGVISGFAIPLLYCIIWGPWGAAWVSMLGAFSGGMTALSWWKSRELLLN